MTHYRFAELATMDAGLGWVATMRPPRLKTAFAEHGYHCATHADALGRRLAELGVSEGVDVSLPPNLRVAHVSSPPNEAFATFVAALQDQDDELLRLVGLYRVLKPHLAAHYRHYILVTDQVCDAPTVRVLRSVLAEEEDHIRWGQAMYEDMASSVAARKRAVTWQGHLEELLVIAGSVIGDRQPPPTAAPDGRRRSVPTRRRGD